MYVFPRTVKSCELVLGKNLPSVKVRFPSITVPLPSQEQEAPELSELSISRLYKLSEEVAPVVFKPQPF